MATQSCNGSGDKEGAEGFEGVTHTPIISLCRTRERLEQPSPYVRTAVPPAADSLPPQYSPA